MTQLTVVMDLGDDVSSFRRRLRTLDDQSVRSDLFEATLVGNLSDEDWEIVASVCRYRPNVWALPQTSYVEAMTTGAGDRVALVRSNEWLLPRSLEVALAHHDLKNVAGLVCRAVVPNGLVPRPLWQEGGQIAVTGCENDPSILLSKSAVVVADRWRAELASDGRLGVSSGQLQVVSAYPFVRRTVDAEGPASEAASLSLASATWSFSVLALSLDVSNLESESELVLRADHDRTGVEILIRPSLRTEALATFEVPIDRASAGEPLESGIWSVRVQCEDGATSMGTVFRVVGDAKSPTALVNGRSVVVCRQDDTLALDVGGARNKLLPQVDPSAGVVTESAEGSRLTLALTDLHMSGSTTVTGRIGIGKLDVPARITSGAEGSCLTAMLTGVKGIEPLSATFGGGTMQTIGLSLEISDLGAMTLVSTPPTPKRPKAATARSVATSSARSEASLRTKKTRPHPRRGIVAELRRLVPAPLEPAVRRVRKNRLASSLYRKLTRR